MREDPVGRCHSGNQQIASWLLEHFHSFNIYLFGIYYEPGTVLDNTVEDVTKPLPLWS